MRPSSTSCSPRARTLADIVPQLRPFLADAIDRDPAAVEKHLTKDAIGPLAAWRARLETVEPFNADAIEAALRALASELRRKAGVLIHATRVAVTGQAVSPGLFEVVELAGRSRVLARVDEVLEEGRP